MKSKMFPIHCNNCSKKRDPENSCQLTRCYHIICSGCLAKSANGRKCPVCKRTTSAIAINRNMPSNVANYFEDPQIFLKMYRSICKFQSQQRTFYYKHFYEQQNRLDTKKETLQAYIKMEAQLRTQIENEKKRISKLRNSISFYDRHDESSLSSIEIPSISGRTSRPTTPSTTTDGSVTDKDGGTADKFLKEFKQHIAKKSPSIATSQLKVYK